LKTVGQTLLQCQLVWFYESLGGRVHLTDKWWQLQICVGHSSITAMQTLSVKVIVSYLL